MKLSRKVVLRLFVRRYNAVSTFVKESFKNSLGLPPGKIDVTFRGVDRATFRRRSDQKRSVEQGGVGPRLITVGRLVGEKGQQYIIDAMPAIRREFPGARLQIAGDGYLAQTLKDRVRDHGLEGAVEFLGYRSDIPELLAAADIFLLPSIIEGCPNALLEAMAVGLPCIASDSGPVPEIITHGRDGVLTRPRDTDAIAEAVIGVAGDPECAARLGNAAAERIASAFTVKTAVGALERFYARALEVEVPGREPSAEVTTEN
jgi:glycosyltransferase involved in cell wall biosynthesis